MAKTDTERDGDGYEPRHVLPLIHEVRVSPTIKIGVEDSHTLILVITDPAGHERARTVLSNGDRLSEAVIVARAWVAMEDDADHSRRVMEAASGDLAKRSPQ